MCVWLLFNDIRYKYIKDKNMLGWRNGDEDITINIFL
jgi:hypothetical protein